MYSILSGFALLGTSALAAEDATATPAPEEVATGRKFKMEVGFRGRYVSVPNGVLDIWYYDNDDDTPGWALPGQYRPKIRGYSGGVEFAVKKDNANGIFYVEYIKSLVPAGYWDDREDPHEPTDGEYLVPTDNLGLVTLGANYAFEAHLVKLERTSNRFGWSLVVGGGLGVALRTGSMGRWSLSDENSYPAYRRFERGEPADDKKANVPPPVLPMVDINFGTRVVFGDRIVVRVEGGLHTMLYYGASVGLVF